MTGRDAARHGWASQPKSSSANARALFSCFRRPPKRLLIDPFKPKLKASHVHRHTLLGRVYTGRNLELPTSLAAKVTDPFHAHSGLLLLSTKRQDTPDLRSTGS